MRKCGWCNGKGETKQLDRAMTWVEGKKQYIIEGCWVCKGTGQVEDEETSND